MPFLLRLLLKVVKKTVLNPTKAVKSFIKHPIKQSKKRIFAPVRSVNSQIKKGKRLGRFVRLTVSPKARLIEDTFKKARTIVAITDEENLLLVSKTSTTIESSETAKELTETAKALKGKNTDEIRAINKVMTKELEDKGIKSADELERVISDEEFRQDIVKTNSYEAFMDNWKDKFFGYKPEEMGMSEDERQAVWDQIESDNTFARFVEKKAS